MSYLPSGFQLCREAVPFQLGGHECRLRDVGGHRDIIEILQKTKGIAVTTQIIVPFASLHE